MTGRYATSTAWLCPSGCYSTTTPKRKPCTRCCGYTADRAKHYIQGEPVLAATKN
jgi:hypothetical protein